MKPLNKTGTVAWSPNEALLAVGTVAGALDLNFSSKTELELYDYSRGSLTRVAGLTASVRFNDFDVDLIAYHGGVPGLLPPERKTARLSCGRQSKSSPTRKRKLCYFEAQTILELLEVFTLIICNQTSWRAVDQMAKFSSGT